MRQRAKLRACLPQGNSFDRVHRGSESRSVETSAFRLACRLITWRTKSVSVTINRFTWAFHWGKSMVRALLLVVVCVSAVGVAGLAVSADSISEKARKLHFSSIVVDTHDDTTQRFLDGKFDLGARSATGSIDIPRLREGNLSAIFFSIWMPSKVTGREAVDRAR